MHTYICFAQQKKLSVAYQGHNTCKRNNHFKKAKDSNDPIDLQLFKATRNKVVSKLRSSKQRFFSSLDPKHPKDFWKSIKALSTSTDDCSILH